MAIPRKKITSLPTKSILDDTDILQVNSSTVDYKLEAKSLIPFVLDPTEIKLIKHDSVVFNQGAGIPATLIPFSIAKPTITQGANILLNKLYNVVSTSNILVIKILVNLAASVGGGHITVALFSDKASSPTISINAATEDYDTAQTIKQIELTEVIFPASDSQILFNVRGGSSNSTSIFLNGNNTGSIFGTSLKSSMDIYEIAP